MDNYTREYTFILPPVTAGVHSYTNTREAAQDLLQDLLKLIIEQRQQGRVNAADLFTEWYEIPLSATTSEYRVALFSTARAVIPEVVRAIRDLANKREYTTLIRTAKMQDVFAAGSSKAAEYFMDTYMSVGGANITSAVVGAKNAYVRQNCRSLVTDDEVNQEINQSVAREVDLSSPETKTTVLRDLGIRNSLYQLKSVVVSTSGDTVTCKLEGPRGEVTHTVPVDREVWMSWPLSLEEAINEETI